VLKATTKTAHLFLPNATANAKKNKRAVSAFALDQSC